MDIANTIKTKRKEKGLTQGAFAEVFGVTKATVSKWECGVSTSF